MCIASKYPKTIYTHCASHRLNLCVMKCCDIREVNNMMQTADAIARFFKYSPKRHLALEKWIEDVVAGEKRKKVKEMCRTRWVECHDAFEVFYDLFLPIVCCFDSIAGSSGGEWNRDTRSDAQSFLLAMSQFSLTVTLVATHNVLAYTKRLKCKLQGPYVDIACAHHEITNVKETLKKARSNANVFHSRIHSQSMIIAQSVGVEERVPCLASKQQHHENTQAETCNDYYRINLTIPLMDHLIHEIESRFEEGHSQNIVEFIQILPSTISTSRSVIDRESLQSTLRLYEDDLPSALSFYAELEMWQQHWTADHKLASQLNTPE